MIIAKDLKRTYYVGKVRVDALRGVDLEIKRGEFVSIMGPSGSGKSTLLHQVGVVDSPSSGSLKIDGIDISSLGDLQRTHFRLKRIGIVFQFYSLLPELTALENVFVPHLVAGKDISECRSRAKELLSAVGLADRANHKPERLSGGEQQRVAVARALVNSPKVLLADEPTANLDTAAGSNIIKIFRELNEKLGLTIVMVTHERNFGRMADRTVWLKDGVVEKTTNNRR